MGHHDKYRSWPQRGHGRPERRDDQGRYGRDEPREYRREPIGRVAGRVRPLSGAAVAVGLVVWTIAAGIGYFAADLVLNWVIASQGTVMTAGKNAATLFGVGAEVGIAVDTLANTGLVGQILGLLRLVLLPGAVAVWLLGAILLVAVPSLIARLVRRRY